MIRVATIGTSTITERFAEGVAAVDGITISHVHSRDPAKAAATAATFGAEPASDLAALLASDAIDAVYVGSPNSVHHGQVLAAVTAGKHVLVEKPAVPTVAEWDELVDAARASGVVLIEAMRTAYDPGLDAVRAALPAVGTVRRVSFRYGKRSSRYDQVLTGERVNIFDPAMAGGALNDLGVYCAHALVSLLGEPERVAAALVPIAAGSDGAGAALAVYEGFVADLSWSKITDSALPSEIQGEVGTLEVDAIDSARRLTLRFVDGRVEERTVDAPAGTLTDEARRFAELIAANGDHTRDQQWTRQTLRLLEAIRAAG
ncbi:Gfo/Idh/MocA family protein [Nakamurella deserti]|uniref:Gfo/Idh/MocA family protein n=1 Tax=Nakamurella deserti TaxID=2164074 RepID=UPI000DBE73CA|nr:Gfo/Idh/MocA family oxidoreductase [Nakamurella deserti]